MTLEPRPDEQQTVSRLGETQPPTRDPIARTARGVALVSGAASFVGVGVDAVSNALPYVSAQELMLLGLALLALAAGRRIPNVWGR
jgi:hypothetical protein